MKYPVYCIRDIKVGFDPQFFVQDNEVAAVRGFKFVLSNENAMQGKFPEDYELYQVADFDTISGVMESVNPPKFIVSGGSIVEK